VHYFEFFGTLLLLKMSAEIAFTATIGGNSTGCGGVHIFQLDRPGVLKVPISPLCIGLHLDTNLTLASQWRVFVFGGGLNTGVLLAGDALSGTLRDVLRVLSIQMSSTITLVYDLPMESAYYQIEAVAAHNPKDAGLCEIGQCLVQIKWVGYAQETTWHQTEFIWPDRDTSVTHACAYFRVQQQAETKHHQRWHTAQVAALAQFQPK
jgi:hypothetical protein